MASVQVKILSASLSGISSPNSSSNAITTSTVSKLSRPKSLTKWELSFTCEVQTKQEGQYNIYRRFGSTNDTHRLVVWIECFPLDVGFRWNRPPYGRQQSGRIRPNSAAFVAASILPVPSRSVPSSTPLFHGVRAKLSVLPQANARVIGQDVETTALVRGKAGALGRQCAAALFSWFSVSWFPLLAFRTRTLDGSTFWKFFTTPRTRSATCCLSRNEPPASAAKPRSAAKLHAGAA